MFGNERNRNLMGHLRTETRGRLAEVVPKLPSSSIKSLEPLHTFKLGGGGGAGAVC